MKNLKKFRFPFLSIVLASCITIGSADEAHKRPVRPKTNSTPFIFLRGEGDTYYKGSKPNPKPIVGRGKYAYKNIRAKDGSIRIDHDAVFLLSYIGDIDIFIEKKNWKGSLWKITWDVPHAGDIHISNPETVPLVNEGVYIPPSTIQNFKLVFALPRAEYVIVKVDAEDEEGRQKASNIAKIKFHKQFENWKVLTGKPYVAKPKTAKNEVEFGTVLHSFLPDDKGFMGETASNVSPTYSFDAHMVSTYSDTENVKDALKLTSIALTLFGADAQYKALISFMSWVVEQDEQGKVHTTDFDNVWNMKATKTGYYRNIQIIGKRPSTFDEFSKKYYKIKPFLLGEFQIKWVQPDKYGRDGYINAPIVRTEEYTGASHPIGHLVRIGGKKKPQVGGSP